MSFPRAAWLLAAISVACTKPLPPPAAPPKVVPGPPARDVGPLVPLGYRADFVGPVDSMVKPDGQPDFALRVRLSGDVQGLVLYSSDATGAPSGGAVWDTFTAPYRYPAEWHLPVPANYAWAIAVVDSKDTLLNPNVVLDKLVFDNETVTILASDPGHGYFVSGHTYSLLVVRKDGRTDRATTTIL